MTSRCSALGSALLLLALGACADAPPEPAGARTRGRTPTSALDESSGSAAAVDATRSKSPSNILHWDAPAAFLPQAEEARRSLRGWHYRVEPSGADKEPAELVVSSAPGGKAGEIEENVRLWLADFDDDAAPTIRRAELQVGDIKVVTVEAFGTYKVGMGPPIGKTGKRAVSVVKSGWRMLAAAVQTLDRGRWFFHLAGPGDTVESVRSGFDALLRSLH